MSTEGSSKKRRSGGKQNSRATDQQINDLLSKLKSLLPEICDNNDKVPASKVLQETCNYIRSLHREVEGLSEKLAELLENTENGSAQAALIRSLLR
ncbi:hypothetical protein SUGI_1078480 [Cryptomeria japonica]|uniref:transcription factor ILI6 n=1 Tax=Cryptomeria japonica TaxID=3369 RepID=UPI0024146DD8|nr:transcription factor ILI6 [Cryptomeria japonica]GLJ50625.1 hypothetical protein SUGI_1078480 [Cryptomeria japonica]